MISSLIELPFIGIPLPIDHQNCEQGTSVLTTLLQSCSPGLSVVNIDKGFGAASMAALIVKKIYKKQ